MKRMEKIVLLFCLTGLFAGQASAKTLYYEKDYQQLWCTKHNGKLEVVLPDKARVDCVTDTHAIEFDFAKKWGESIGQALYYATILNKQAGIVLIMEKGVSDEKYLARVQEVAKHYNITIWTMTPKDMNIKL